MATIERHGEWILRAAEAWTSVSPDRDSVYSFDLEGRPLSWFEEGRLYKRSLASEVHLREREGGRRRRRRLSPEEAAGSFARIAARIARAPAHELEAPLRARLDDVLRWSVDDLLAERERFAAVYRPISILPPDQYLAVVLQATFGCSWNRCTFCSFYQDRPFSARTPETFAEHARRVDELLGRGAALRRDLFLADGNALILSRARLLPLLHVARERFPGRAIHGFVDVFHGERKPSQEWAELRQLGLGRVTIGLETGHDALLRWLHKPGTSEEAAELIAALKAAGLLVSPILMVGVGGRRFAEAHVRDSLDLVARLPLGAGDLVYLSPFVEKPDSAYAARAREEGLAPLDEREAAAQYARLRDRIRERHPAVKVARYDIREFLY